MASPLELYLLALLTGGNAPPAVQTDPTVFSVPNPTAGTAIAKAWSLLPGTPQAGTVYEAGLEFTLTWEANALALGVLVGGTFTQFAPSVGAPSWPASPNPQVGGWLRLTIRVLNATQARFAIWGAIGETTASYTPGTGSIPLALLSQTLTIAAADTIALGAYFGASNGSQGIGSYGSTWTTINGAA